MKEPIKAATLEELSVWLMWQTDEHFPKKSPLYTEAAVSN